MSKLTLVAADPNCETCHYGMGDGRCTCAVRCTHCGWIGKRHDGHRDSDCVARLVAERRWIPVSERLPEPGKSGDYLVIEALPMGLQSVAIRTWLHDRSTCGWQRPGGFPVTHWRPIGPLPEVKG